MAQIRFPSLAHPNERGYLYDSMEYHAHPPLDDSLLTFDTYGDGVTQHSPAYPIGVSLFEDYLYSLAAYLVADPDAITTIGWKFQSPNCDRDIEFAHSVTWKEGGKDRYYSLAERKISANDKFRHDRRYEVVQSWMDGSPEAVCRLLWKEYYSPLQTYALNNAVREWELAQKNGSALDLPTLGGDAQWEQRRSWHSAWEAIQTITKALKWLDASRCQIENYKRHLEVSVSTD